MTKRAFIYTRISQDGGSEGLGVQRQEDACREYAVKHGMQVTEVFSDNSVSAYSGRVRPAYSAMLKGLQARDADAVICWRMDRLHRRPIELEKYAEICRGPRRAAPILTYPVTGGGEIELSTADGLLRAGIMGQVARFESSTKRDHARSKAAQLAAEGKWTGGRRPFGWHVVEGRLVLNEREAEALAVAHADVVAGRKRTRALAKTRPLSEFLTSYFGCTRPTWNGPNGRVPRMESGMHSATACSRPIEMSDSGIALVYPGRADR